MNTTIFRAYDIRGIASSADPQKIDLTPEVVHLIGKAAGTYLKRNYNVKKMAVGRDVRLTSETLQAAYIKGITESGINVTNIGLAASPMVYWSVCSKNLDFDCATNITASHNPKDYNGLKIVTKNAHSICGDELQKIRQLIENRDFETATEPGKIDHADITNLYFQDLGSRFQLKKSLKLVVDAGNGVAGIFAPTFLRNLGHQVVELYCEPDGNFPNHEANPEEPHNMQDLMAKVISEKADLGIGFDGDGDRVGIIDEQGKMYHADFMLLLLATELKTRKPNGSVIYDVKVSQTIINEIKKLGLQNQMSKTGHSFMEQKMREINADLGGELSGHIFFGENYYGFDDALYAAAKIVEIVSLDTKPLSQNFTHLPKTYATPEYKIPCPDSAKFTITKQLVEAFTKRYDCITIDGVRINFDDKSWAAVRASNTSPCLTARFEADTPEKLADLKQILLQELRKYPEIDSSVII